jgi:hypothetical protein
MVPIFVMEFGSGRGVWVFDGWAEVMEVWKGEAKKSEATFRV